MTKYVDMIIVWCIQHKTGIRTSQLAQR